MFNLYVVLTSHYTVTAVGRASFYRLNFNSRSLQTKSTKLKDLPKTWFLTEKQFEDFRRKKEQKQYSSPFRKKPNGKQRTPHVSIDHGPRKQ